MKTVFLTTSPKKHKKWVNSTYWLFIIFASLFWIIRAIGHAIPIWKMFHKVPEQTQESRL